VTAPNVVAKWSGWAPRRLSVLRIFLAFIFFAPQGFWPIMNNGVTPAVCCFVWLYVSAAGAGPWSLDAKRGR